MVALYGVLVGLASLWAVAAVVALARLRAGGPRARQRATLGPGDTVTLAPITVLKPLCGADPELERNLRTFFEQTHPRYELVFGVQGERDPAIDIVRRLRADYPWVPCRLVVHDGGRGLNPKVSNLRAMVDAASHDLLVIGDSNVAVPAHYLCEMANAMCQPDTGIVMNLFAGSGAGRLGAVVESLHLNTTIAAGIATATELLGHPVVVGKSMMFRRAVFDRLGGFESVASVLAEDYVMGRMFHAAGYRVRICATPVRNVCGETTLRSFFERHVRWAMIRIRMQPLAYALEPLSMPLVVALAGPPLGVGGGWPLLWALAVTAARDGASWWIVRGPRGLAGALPLFPVRDAIVLAAWASAALRRRVVWRGTRMRVSAGTRLYAEREPAEPSSLVMEG